ncbi:MAG: peptidylprolyl isomerase, partial [Gemmataceae bacterium]
SSDAAMPRGTYWCGRFDKCYSGVSPAIPQGETEKSPGLRFLAKLAIHRQGNHAMPTTTLTTVTLLFLSFAQTAKPEPVPAAATVNGVPIPLARVDTLVQQQFPRHGALRENQLRELRHTLTQELIDEALFDTFLAKNAPPVTAAEVDAAFEKLRANLSKAGRPLAEQLRTGGQTEAEFKATWARLWQFEQYLGKHFTEKDIRAYYTAHPEVFDRSKVTVEHIRLRVPAGAPPGERAAAHAQLLEVKKRLDADPELFGAFAQKLSDCPSAPRGGKLGAMSRHDPAHDEPFRAAAFTAPVGLVQGPVDTSSGVHLLRVTQKTAGTLPPFETVRDWAAECLAEEKRTLLLARLRKEATIVVTVPEK